MVADVYREKYTGISLALAMLSRALNSSYVNFGVFELFNDPALSNALRAAMQLALAVPSRDVTMYAKVAKSYFVFLEAICHNHTAFLVSEPHSTFVTVVECLSRGVVSIDVQASSQCAMAIDNLASWLYKQLTAPNGKAHAAMPVRLSHLTPPTTLRIDCSVRDNGGGG